MEGKFQCNMGHIYVKYWLFMVEILQFAEWINVLNFHIIKVWSDKLKLKNSALNDDVVGFRDWNTLLKLKIGWCFEN